MYYKHLYILSSVCKAIMLYILSLSTVTVMKTVTGQFDYKTELLAACRFTYLIWCRIADLNISSLCWMPTLRRVSQVLWFIGESTHLITVL